MLELTILTETNPETGHRVCDGAGKSERVVQVVMMVGVGHIGRREIIKLDLLHQKRAGHVSVDENTGLRETHERK